MASLRVAAVTGPRRFFFFFRKPAQSSAQVETPREASAPDFSKDGKDGAFKEFLVDGLNDLGGPGYYDAKAGKAAGVAAIGGPVGVVIGAAVEAAMAPNARCPAHDTPSGVKCESKIVATRGALPTSPRTVT